LSNTEAYEKGKAVAVAFSMLLLHSASYRLISCLEFSLLQLFQL